MIRRVRGGVATLAVAFLTVSVNGAPLNFIPDYTFKGSTLTGWKAMGQANWKAVDGELIGTATSPEGGWLMLERGLQDFQFGAELKCPAGCKAGVLVRAQRQPDGGLKGIFIPFGEGETGIYTLTLDGAGKEVGREAAVGPIGGMVRYAPAPPDPNAPPPARGGGGGLGRGARPWAPAEWNDIGIIVDVNTMRKLSSGIVVSAAAVAMNGFGPIALYVGGTAEAHYRGVSYQDVGLKRFPKEQTSQYFTGRRVNPFFYGFSVGAADMNRDGHVDFVSGPFIYYGPDFTTGREFYAAETLSPSTDFPSNPAPADFSPRGAGDWVAFAADFTGDGWGDVLLANTSGSALYVNPGQDGARRWDVHKGVIPPAGTTQAEINTLADIDKDGKPDLVYSTQQLGVSWAKPDPANPTGTWIATSIGGQGTYAAHGIGAGDINGDGRLDVLNATGWWEQPASGPLTPNWKFHPGPFGQGGAEMAVYDINGDGLSDVITSRQAHNFGLGWYEQKKNTATGEITFEEHVIFTDYSTEKDNAGGVAFSELHGSAMGDINGDGIPDFVVGKRLYSHHESFLDLDPYGPPVLYAYLTVRDPKAPGGARFVPELINNASGAGSQVIVTDINKDGINDVLTGGVNGSFIFFGKARSGTKATAPAKQ